MAAYDDDSGFEPYPDAAALDAGIDDVRADGGDRELLATLYDGGAGATYGGGEDRDDLLPAEYVRAYASALPTPREDRYDPLAPGVPEPIRRDKGDLVSDATLQRETRVIGHGRSSGSKGRTKDATGGAVFGVRGRRDTSPTPEDGADANRHLPSLHVSGFSLGVWSFFQKRPGYDVELTRQYVADAIVRGALPEDDGARAKPARGDHDRWIRGLSEAQVIVARLRRGALRRFLSDVAAREDCDVANIDRGWYLQR